MGRSPSDQVDRPGTQSNNPHESEALPPSYDEALSEGTGGSGPYGASMHSAPDHPVPMNQHPASPGWGTGPNWSTHPGHPPQGASGVPPPGPAWPAGPSYSNGPVPMFQPPGPFPMAPGVPQHYVAGDPRLGGHMCPKCKGDGWKYTMLGLDTETCWLCRGVGRVYQ